MPQHDYSHLTLVVDRSGSMASVKNDAQGGVNTLLADQRQIPGKLTVTLVEFDHLIEDVCRMTPISDVKDYELNPRGSTALLDAVGRAVVETGRDLAALPEYARPAHVMLAIVTDGEENASHEWQLDAVKNSIAHQQDKYGWKTLFIGADAAAWTGQALGTSSTVSYANTAAGTQQAYGVASASLAQLRSTGDWEVKGDEDVEVIQP